MKKTKLKRIRNGILLMNLISVHISVLQSIHIWSDNRDSNLKSSSKIEAKKPKSNQKPKIRNLLRIFSQIKKDSMHNQVPHEGQIKLIPNY